MLDQFKKGKLPTDLHDPFVLVGTSLFSTESFDQIGKGVISDMGVRSTITHPDRLSAHLSGRRTLLQLLHHHLGVAGSIEQDKVWGYLKFHARTEGVPQLYLSVAHTDNRILAAVSNSPVGVDIENSVRKIPEGIERAFTEAEIKQLQALQDQSQYDPSLMLWTLKEAFSKSTGLGLASNFQAFEVSLSESPPFMAKCKLETPFHVRMGAVDSFVFQNYLCAISTQDPFALESAYWQEVSL